MRPPEDQEPTGRERVLQTALQYVMNDREMDYGGPEDSFSTISRFWNAYIESRPNPDAPLDAYDVSVMMVLFKAARMVKRPSKIDSCIDAAGYSACAGEILNDHNRLVAPPPLDSMFGRVDTGLQPLETERASEPPTQEAPKPPPVVQQEAPKPPPVVPRRAPMKAPQSGEAFLHSSQETAEAGKSFISDLDWETT